MIRIICLSIVSFLFLGNAALAAVCFGSEQNADVFVNIELCAAQSDRQCTVICMTPDEYERLSGALTLARFIVAVGDGGVDMATAETAARKKFGTGRTYEIGNVVVESNLCRNPDKTERVVCDF